LNKASPNKFRRSRAPERQAAPPPAPRLPAPPAHNPEVVSRLPKAAARLPMPCTPGTPRARATVRARYGPVVRLPFSQPRPLSRMPAEVRDLARASAIAGARLVAATPFKGSAPRREGQAARSSCLDAPASASPEPTATKHPCEASLGHRP
jgi:hypothetical protein